MESNGKFWLVCFAVIVAGAVAFVSLGDKTLDDHEVFVSVTAREMTASNEYIVPTFNAQRRLNKTPLPYWLVVAAEHLTGRFDEFTTRLPTAFMAVLSAISILYFVTVLLDFRTAFLASLVWTCSLGYIRYSHCARPEMVLTFFTLTSFLSFYAAIEGVNRKRQISYAVIFWFSLGLSVLAKAPSSIFFLGFSSVLYLTIHKRWRQLSRILPLWGMLLFLAIVLPWPIAAARAMHWDLTLWKEESLGRFSGEAGGGGHSWLYYISTTLLFMLPWTAFLPHGIAAPFFKVWQGKRRFTGYLSIAFLSGILFMTLCAGKRQHYILPLMPLAAILIAVIVEDMMFGRKVFDAHRSVSFLGWHMAAFTWVGIMAAAMVIEPVYGAVGRAMCWASAVAGKNAVMPPYSRIMGDYGLMIGVILLLGVGLGICFNARKKPVLACVAVLAAVTAVTVTAYSATSAIGIDENRPLARFALRVKDTIPAGEDLFADGEPEGVFVYYFGRPLKNVAESDVEVLYDAGRWILASSDEIDKLKREHDLQEVAIATYNKGGRPREMRVFHTEDTADDHRQQRGVSLNRRTIAQ